MVGCVAVPIPQGEGEVTEGREITAEGARAIEIGRTSRGEVLDRLGEPAAIWAEQRVFVYAWDRVHMKLLWAAGGGYSGAVGVLDVPTHYMLLLQFDLNDRVSRAERCVRPALTRYGTFLREWADGQACE